MMQQKKEEPESSSQVQQVQVTGITMFVPQSRSSRQNVLCERVSKDVESQSTEPCQAEEACQVFETRETVGSNVRIREIGRRGDNIHRFGLGRLQGNSKVIKRKRDNVGRAVRSGIGSV